MSSEKLGEGGVLEMSECGVRGVSCTECRVWGEDCRVKRGA